MASLPVGLDVHINAILKTAKGLEGYLSDKEIRFLCLLGSVPTTSGEVLEIGSFKGKSTVILANSVRFAGGERVIAIDPLTLSCETDPPKSVYNELEEEFNRNLASCEVDHLVEFHKALSTDMSASWNRTLRLLWIDGDHTCQGTKHDFDAFGPFLNLGAIVAFHDVLHGYYFQGPLKVFRENVLLSGRFGACGICGSIGWGQYIGEAADNKYQKRNVALADKLQSFNEFLVSSSSGRFKKYLYEIRRALIPHGSVDPDEWVKKVNFY